MGSKWFTSWFKKIREASNLSDAEIGRKCGITNEKQPGTYTQRWYSGVFPQTQEMVEDILNAFGGNIRRALPDYDPLRDLCLQSSNDAVSEIAEGLETILWKGDIRVMQVSAGKPLKSVEDLRLVRATPLWDLTGGDVFGYQVADHSMEPLFRKGARLFCRRPKDAKSLPDALPIIVKYQRKRLCRELIWADPNHKRLVLRASNPGSENLPINLSDCEIEGVVIEVRQYPGEK